MTGLLLDLRLGARGLMRAPGFTALAVAVLALGTGAATTVYSVAHTLFLRDLPFPESGRLVTVWEADPRQSSGKLGASPADFVDWGTEARGFEDLAALVVRGGMIPVAAGLVFGLLAAAALGRLVSGMLYHVSPLEPAVLVPATLCLGAAAAAACLIPARRAARIDPIEALRQE